MSGVFAFPNFNIALATSGRLGQSVGAVIHLVIEVEFVETEAAVVLLFDKDIEIGVVVIGINFIRFFAHSVVLVVDNTPIGALRNKLRNGLIDSVDSGRELWEKTSNELRGLPQRHFRH